MAYLGNRPATGESAQIDQAYNLGVAITLPDSPIPPPIL